jgi:hypothetical protein
MEHSAVMASPRPQAPQPSSARGKPPPGPGGQPSKQAEQPKRPPLILPGAAQPAAYDMLWMSRVLLLACWLHCALIWQWHSQACHSHSMPVLTPSADPPVRGPSHPHHMYQDMHG